MPDDPTRNPLIEQFMRRQQDANYENQQQDIVPHKTSSQQTSRYSSTPDCLENRLLEQKSDIHAQFLDTRWFLQMLMQNTLPYGFYNNCQSIYSSPRSIKFMEEYIWHCTNSLLWNHQNNTVYILLKIKKKHVWLSTVRYSMCIRRNQRNRSIQSHKCSRIHSIQHYKEKCACRAQVVSTTVLSKKDGILHQDKVCITHQLFNYL